MPTVAVNAVPRVDLGNLPKTSLLRLYDPSTQGNSFSLDGFPLVPSGGDWLTRLIEVIEQQGAVSMTTNQTLFRQLTDGGALDSQLRALKAQGKGAKEIYWTLYSEAAMHAAHVFGDIHARWPWDGRVSQEASALLMELEPLTSDVLRIAKALWGVGAFAKVPNVKVGPQALRRALAQIDPFFQVHPNVTLVFSDRHYLDTVEGYLLGLQDRVKGLQGRGGSTTDICKDISQIYSVNSLFVSRTDRVVDPMIDKALTLPSPLRGEGIKGKVAVAQAKKIYQIFEAIFLEKPFQDPEGLYADAEGTAMIKRIEALRDLFRGLRKLSANPQRLLIASSGVKSDQPYSSLLYVLPFLGPWCANTMPEATLRAFSQFVAGLSDADTERFRVRNFMREPLPAIPSPLSSPQRGEGGVRGAMNEWDQAILAGTGTLTPDRILKEVQEKVLKPARTSLREIGDTLRDKGAASFTADEQATLQAIEFKLAGL